MPGRCPQSSSCKWTSSVVVVPLIRRYPSHRRLGASECLGVCVALDGHELLPLPKEKLKIAHRHIPPMKWERFAETILGRLKQFETIPRHIKFLLVRLIKTTIRPKCAVSWPALA